MCKSPITQSNKGVSYVVKLLTSRWVLPCFVGGGVLFCITIILFLAFSLVINIFSLCEI